MKLRGPTGRRVVAWWITTTRCGKMRHARPVRQPRPLWVAAASSQLDALWHRQRRLHKKMVGPMLIPVPQFP